MGHTAAVSPSLAGQCWGAALGGSGTPICPEHRRPQGCVEAALQACLRDGPPPTSFPTPRGFRAAVPAPISAPWDRECLRDVCEDAPLPSRELLSSDAMKEYSRARVYLDEDYKSQEHFTVSALRLGAGVAVREFHVTVGAPA